MKTKINTTIRVYRVCGRDAAPHEPRTPNSTNFLGIASLFMTDGGNCQSPSLGSIYTRASAAFVIRAFEPVSPHSFLQIGTQHVP